MPVALGFADASPAAALAPEAVPDVKVDGIIMVTGVGEKCGNKGLCVGLKVASIGFERRCFRSGA